jgi:Uma2 family endonuclease
MPTDRHQAVLTALLLVLFEHAKRSGGWARPAGIRLRLAGARFREPDVAFLSKDHAAKKGEEYWTGADLVVEVVSGGADDAARDYVAKRREYAQAGITEYWIVDPLADKATVLVLDGDTYREHGVFTRGDVVRSATLADVAFDVTAVLDAD